MDTLITRSAKLESKVLEFFEYKPHEDTDKYRLSRIMCSVSIEHAESFKILLATRNFTSAIGLIRNQFECFDRGV
jgi:hypothetical protein